MYFYREYGKRILIMEYGVQSRFQERPYPGHDEGNLSLSRVGCKIN